jgi:hypothetical protein
METIIIFFVVTVAIGLLVQGGSSPNNEPPVIIVQLSQDSNGVGCLPATLIILFTLLVLTLVNAS